ncbi:PREDICTED: glutathione S-transferase T3-like [Camelina sativa]|uniref:Glutathione S-transferase T3-like n=1 Tax=Camelina sativa TaxID=90675 RepID=A0ABM1RPM8_CAMSA|nr:PREDICTED: glutathione S-transferase T3-like [Camelina sativa]
MDSTNPFGFQPYNFMNLLNSQKNSNVSNNSAQTSQPVQFSSPFSSQPIQFSDPFSSQPIQFSSPFSSQPINLSTQSESEDCIEVTVDDNEEDGGRGSRKRWTAYEDINLISAWLNTSKDPVVSNEQRLDSFWVRVAAYYKANGGGTGSNGRGASQCKARWNKINHQVNKFVGCYTQASNRKKSGESEDDVIKVAHEIYMNDIKKPFILEHCWRELKHDQKWIMEECSSKRTKLQSDGTYSSSPANDGAEMRPPGVKAAKKKGKKPASVSIDVEDGSVGKLDRIIAMKDQEQAAKERHAKMRLLDSLINKGELTPAEVILRDKLLDQMLTNI